MANPQYVYHMHKLSKAYPGGKQVLKDISLSFLPGAKIGVVGPNGAGKSTVLQIMAGMQQPSNGEASLAPDATVGILLQEPPLNEELADPPTGEDYGAGSGSLYVVDSENSSPEPARV